MKYYEVKEIPKQDAMPCPFCGGEASAEGNEYDRMVDAIGRITLRGVATQYQVRCGSCGATGPIAKIPKGLERHTWWRKNTKNEAVALWNRRDDNA